MTTNNTISVISPLDASVIGDVPCMDSGAVESMVASAVQAQKVWAAYTPEAKRSQLLQVAAKIREQSEKIAEIETANTGKPLADTTREVERAAKCFEYYAGWADHSTGEHIPMGPDDLVYTVREPLGVALGIIPWNMPFAFAAKKIAPALAFGNAVIVKPAPETPLTALLLQEIIAQCGFPEGLVHIAVGAGELGASLVNHPDIGLIVFTGSVPTGKIVAGSAAQNLTPCVLELGGSSAQVIFADADLAAAADSVVLGGFGSTGQMCVAGRQVLVEASIAEEFGQMVAERVNRLVAGDVRKAGVSIGPQTTRNQWELTTRAIDVATDQGAKVLARGSIAPDVMVGQPFDSQATEVASSSAVTPFYVAPVLFTDLPPDSILLQEEVFGPVVTLRTFTTVEEACELVNKSDFGLVAGIWTNNVVRAHRMANALEVGTVWINTFRVLHDRVPFGGVKASGYGRENGQSALETYTRVKAVWASLKVGNTHGYRLGNQ